MLPNNKTIDRAIGQRLRAHRLAARMSQTDLGKHLGVTFQQISEIREGHQSDIGLALGAADGAVQRQGRKAVRDQ